MMNEAAPQRLPTIDQRKLAMLTALNESLLHQAFSRDIT